MEASKDVAEPSSPQVVVEDLPPEDDDGVPIDEAPQPDPVESSRDESGNESEDPRPMPRVVTVSTVDKNVPGDTRHCLVISAVQMEGSEHRFPDPALWTRQILTMGFRPYLGNLLTEALPIGRGDAVLFCGRRSNGRD